LPPAAPDEPQPGFAHGFGSAIGALALAAATLGRKRLPQTLRRWVSAVWVPLASGLRTLHTGEVGDQVAWLTLGAALLGCAMVFLG